MMAPALGAAAFGVVAIAFGLELYAAGLGPDTSPAPKLLRVGDRHQVKCTTELSKDRHRGHS